MATKLAVVHLTSMAQAGRDVSRIKREVLILEKVVEHRGTQKAAAALREMKFALVAAEAKWQGERTTWNSYRRIAEEYKSARASEFGKRALALEDALKLTSGGRQLLDLGKLIPWNTIGKGLVVAGVGIALTEGVEEASARTVLGKAATGAMSGAASAMVNLANPAIGLADFAYKKVTGDKVNTLGNFYQATSNNIAALSESLLTRNSEPLNSAHKKAIQGQQGRVLQGWAMIGEGIANIIDPALTHAADLCRCSLRYSSIEVLVGRCEGHWRQHRRFGQR